MYNERPMAMPTLAQWQLANDRFKIEFSKLAKSIGSQVLQRV